jgi:hypothetical protein
LAFDPQKRQHRDGGVLVTRESTLRALEERALAH